ncbi:MAG: nucleoside kinase [Bacteroidales bacterium]|nr:nucleoside kinase [Bacteroidales bacterium]
METIQIFCENTSSLHDIRPGARLSELCKTIDHKCKYRALGAIVDNQLKELSYNVYSPHIIKFIDMSHPDGRRMYIRSLSFLAQRCALDLFPEHRLTFNYSLPSGLYGEIIEKKKGEDGKYKALRLSAEQVALLKSKMEEYVELDLPFIKKKLPKDIASSIFRENGYQAKAILAEESKQYFISTYYLDGYADTYYGPLLDSTGYLNLFDVIPYSNGFCLQAPSTSEPWKVADYKYQDKLNEIFKEHSEWNDILGIESLAHLNKAVSIGKTAPVIQIAEALHERKYANIADMIHNRRDQVKLVLIAGPSSSGKTTSSNRIAIQCRTLGLNPIVIEMDNYFVSRDKTPLDENGEYDFESLYAMDLEFLNQQLNDILAGKEVELPKFDFVKGERIPSGRKIRMTEKDILIMEGIHALNKELTKDLDQSKLFRIYVSALTSLSLDENNVISTTDCRLLRRMVRDARTRGVSPEETILRWPSVRRGEEKNIFPFQENADVMFNSSLIFELPLLKYYAEPHLNRIPVTSPAYSESVRMLKFLSHITPLTPEEIVAVPPTSVLREFIGGSSIKY